MAKAWMGKVAEKSSRAGWRLSVVLTANPARAGKTMTPVMERDISHHLNLLILFSLSIFS